jgi:hypothetical protein
VAVNSGLVGLWGATGAGEFWPFWSIAPWGVAVVWHGLATRALSRRVRRRVPEVGTSRRGGALPR